MKHRSLLNQILTARGIDAAARASFLSPDYDVRHDPFLLPDMGRAVERLVRARERQERITIYGDYDIDGLTATAVLLDAFESFGFEHVEAFVPNRFVEGYGLTVDAVERIAAAGAQLIVTVDCGSLSEREIVRAGELGVDVIVTDHHNVAPVQPPAVAVVNPKRLLQGYPEFYKDFCLISLGADETSRSSEAAALRPVDVSVSASSPKIQNPKSKIPPLYPFLDLAGVGVAFKLVQALQTRLSGLEPGREKWLLDLVALGTVCDVVTLRDENRTNVYWGLKVMQKTRRPGLKALMAVSRVEPAKLNARSLGFALGPRMNASGRLETAEHALKMLRAREPMEALTYAQQLDALNIARRSDQDKIFKMAIEQAEARSADPVLVVSHPEWNHGIIGIVAAKLLEKYKKPAYVLQELGGESKGSARSYGDFSAADAIRAADDLIIKGGGHKLAAGVTLPTANIEVFRRRVNDFYRSQNLFNQAALLLPKADITLSDLSIADEELLAALELLEPYGNGNPEPVFRADGLVAAGIRRMGADSQHVRLDLRDNSGYRMSFLAFNAPEHYFVEPGEYVSAWFQLTLNEWQGRRSVEGRLLHLETN